MRKSWMMTAVVTCALGASLFACVPQEHSATEPISEASPQLTADGTTIGEQVEELKKRNEEYLPEIVTMPDGVQVQKVPTSGISSHVAGVTGFDLNVYYLDGNNRGCTSCHTEGLTEVVNGITGHMKLAAPFVYEMNPLQCNTCHDSYGLNTGDIIHEIHSKDTFKGDCNSCHIASDGTMKLWDISKYDDLDGLTPIDASTIQPDFTYEQDTLTDFFKVDWLYDEFQVDMYSKSMRGDELDPAVFENWEVSFTGAVNNPTSIKLPDLIAEAEKAGAVKEFDFTMGCLDGLYDAGFISNNHYKGIDFNWLMEFAGVTDEAVAVTPITPNGNDFSNTTGLDQIDKCIGTYMVYEADGKPLSWDQGYPFRFISSWYGAGGTMKWVSELRFETVESVKANPMLFVVSDDPELLDIATIKTVPSTLPANFVGFTNIYDGQIIPAGEPFDVTGYAFNPNLKVAAVEVSLDKGETWSTLDTSDSKLGTWVYWHFKMPYEPGAYTIRVRAIMEDGAVTEVLTDKCLNAK